MKERFPWLDENDGRKDSKSHIEHIHMTEEKIGKTHRAYPKTETERRSRELEKLLKKVDKPVELQLHKPEKSLPPPPDFVSNVQSSSSGAGSGEFHTYKIARKREYERIKFMDEQVKREKELKEYEEKRSLQAAKEEAKLAKNRLKRLKRKQQKQGETKKPKIDDQSQVSTEKNHSPVRGMKQDIIDQQDEDEDDKEQLHSSAQSLSNRSPAPVVSSKNLKIVDEDDGW